MNKILVDSSFLYTLYNANDSNHAKALEFGETTIAELVVPDVTLPEVTFLFNREGGTPAVITFLNNFAEAGVVPECLIIEDIQRAQAIMKTYLSAHFDFVDCAIMALAERLNIKQILTFDRRDFSIVRPTHCDYLELLP